MKMPYRINILLLTGIFGFILSIIPCCRSTPQHINLGQKKYEEGDIKGAIEEFTQAILSDPKNASAYFNRGLVYQEMGNLEKAHDDYSSAIEFDPDNIESYFNRGMICLELGDTLGAIEDFDSVIEQNPKRALAYYNRGQSKYKRGNNSGAEEDYTRCIELLPDYLEAYYNRGLIYQQSGNIESALKDYNRVLDLNANHIETLFNRGTIYQQTGELEKALDDYNQIINKSSGHAAARFNRGLVYAVQKKVDEAIQDFRLAVYIEPELEDRILEFVEKNQIISRKKLDDEVFKIAKSEQNKLLPPELLSVLKGSGDYCERIKNIALFYVCKEKITHIQFSYGRRNLFYTTFQSARRLKIHSKKEKTFLYDYQLIKKEEELKESRILLEENGKKRHQKNAPFPPLKYNYQYLIYGPVGFLSRYWQDFFHFEYLGKEKVNDRQAVVIRSIPKERRKENYNFGKIWIDAENKSILKIEYDPKSIRYYREEKLRSPIGNLRKETNWIIYYGVEKNGVRFPSRQIIRDFYINNQGEKLLMEEIVTDFLDYQFFVVETDIKFDSSPS
ncbi:MAG: tetratricopeptide repeat protein [Candidatus Aminicenantes bacterium]|nr:tetratricopeptide repeat protein [Candidatus Aminicenantes bacterium]